MKNEFFTSSNSSFNKTALPKTKKKSLRGILSLTLMAAALAVSPQVTEASEFTHALTSGKASLNVRYRYEMVDQDGISKKAHANTVRSRLGYKTGSFKGVSGFLEFEDVTSIGKEQYNSTANGKTQYPVVADPEDTEINQVYLQFTGIEGLTIKGGRQRIKLDNDRFIGNVGWRQNEQTFDALALIYSPMADTSLIYTYVENVNRIFGEHHATNSDILTETHIVHFSFTGMPVLKVSAYAYLLDIHSAGSHKTIGLRLTGAKPVGNVKLLYTAEYADQSDHANGASSNDADYHLLELGVSMKDVTVKLSREFLSGDGTYEFGTPLATVHAFQGWADKFILGSPGADGIEDHFLTVSGKVAGIKLVGVYHMFSSDNGGYDYGKELNLLAVKKLSDNYAAGIKYASYSADSDVDNTGGTAVDADKLWIFGELKF